MITKFGNATIKESAMADGWRIVEDMRAKKAARNTPKQIRDKYEYWKALIEGSGPMSIRIHNVPSFKDHALIGNWKGYRSSYLSIQYRVIYSIDEGEGCIYVERLGPHNY